MIRINQLMMAFSVFTIALAVFVQNAPMLWHRFQLWSHGGVSCQRSDGTGAPETHYGKDCY